jgi:5-methylcytosine-specific restriction endonuclease McrA
MAIGSKKRFAIFRRDNFTCRYCGRKGVAPERVLDDAQARDGDPAVTRLMISLGLLPEEPPREIVLEIDHRVPKAAGGTDDESNLVTSCRDCNRGKGKTLIG